ncbi:MAG: hypothetical protein H6658_00470 [Ardenticatenaceae bacterium]|nr:hypothetical protein [Ardenticatenaceae bacterium]
MLYSHGYITQYNGAMISEMRRLQINGGRVEPGSPLRLVLPAVAEGYADAQVDDYGSRKRREYPWRRGTEFVLRARFSHDAHELIGTAGFGFWNAPFGDPTVPWPALPQAAWFFFGSPPNDLPLAPNGPGRGWFAATLDATTGRALVMAPFAPVVVLLNRITAVRRRLWPGVQQRLGISFAPLNQAMTDWHEYRLVWQPGGCVFEVDGELVLQTEHSPRGPLGFVCWLDNQFMVVGADGRLRWGTLPVAKPQWLEVDNLNITNL